MNERRFGGEIERLRAPQRLERLEVERVVTLCLDGLTDARSMLDIGTGSAVFAEAFADKGLSVAGVDLREDMLDAARSYVPTGDFRLAHMEKLPFDDRQFDLAFMGCVLHEADDLLTARVAVLEWPYEAQEFGPPLEHRLTDESIRAAAIEAGFKHVEGLTLKAMILYRLEVADRGQ